MSDPDVRSESRARHGSVRASLVSVACVLRGVPRLFFATPQTPLRVLCIVALDTLSCLRRGHRLRRQKIQELATFLDFQACTNALWDQKALCAADYQAMRQRLESAGLRSWIQAYVEQLRELESGRPAVGGDDRRFNEAREYREAVARLSLATIIGVALDADGLEAALQDTRRDGDVATLFRIVMQCQIIDDVLDYQKDLSAGLPSFLTAPASLAQAMELTGRAARSYAASAGEFSGRAVWPLQVALSLVTAVTKVVIRLAHLRLAHRDPRKAHAS